jgi:hypothetical protein
MARAGYGQQLWFTCRRGAVSGPYPSRLVSRYLTLGRLDLNDQVSLDRKTWAPISNHPELVPPELLLPDDARGREARIRARVREDERRAISPGGADYRDRRAPEPAEFIHHRIERHGLVQAEPRNEAPGSVPWKLAGVAVILTLGLLMLQGDGREVTAERECLAPAGPGVNWSHCRMAGLDLQGVNLAGSRLESINLVEARLSGAQLPGARLDYADLRRADLRRCNLAHASLVGAILQDTRLDGARLTGADLAYADLRGTSLENVNLEGVRLERAMWTDGRVCADGSVGECL